MGRALKRKTRTIKGKQDSLSLILSPSSPNDIVGLLRAWRFWFLVGLMGALLGTAAYAVVPPPYRGRATVNVDFHLEQAWPQNTDREQFYYLERETRKLVEIAWSDAVLEEVAGAVSGVTMEELRAGMLQLGQPGSGGWHFYADDRDPSKAESVASAWARAFSTEVERQVEVASTGALERFITADVVQAASIPAQPASSAGTYMLVSAGVAVTLSALGVLLFRFRR